MKGQWYEAHTKRGVPYDAYDRPALPPLKHAVSRTLPRASRTGKNYRAACGASVAVVVDRAFVPGLARSCRKCAKAISS